MKTGLTIDYEVTKTQNGESRLEISSLSDENDQYLTKTIWIDFVELVLKKTTENEILMTQKNLYTRNLTPSKQKSNEVLVSKEVGGYVGTGF